MQTPLSDATPRAAQRRPWLWLGAALVAAGVLSCATVTRTVLVPPQIPGATYVGSKTCEDCHDNITRDFPSATHANLQALGDHALEMGCESCHGPGSVHSEVGGGKLNILNPKKSPELCLQCHLDLRGKFAQRSHHPLGPNRLTCGDCHNPHKGPALPTAGLSTLAQNEACLKCHPAQRGPHVFEHEAMREGCTTCHDPHGSVNPRLLTARNANLCLKCHFQERTPAGVRIGGQDHTLLLGRGTCWTAGCHEAVHGSMVNSSLRY